MTRIGSPLSLTAPVLAHSNNRPQNAAVKKRDPVGVYFSVAVLILFGGGWCGTKIGKRAAVCRFRHQRRQQEEKYGPERAHLDAELDELFAVDLLRILVADDVGSKTIGAKPLFGAVDDLRYLEEHPNPLDSKPFVAVDLGLADVRAAVVEQQENNNALAEGYMNSAQTIFRSLGWRDTSEESLKNMMKTEFDRFYAPLPAEGPVK
jgi:hypothetical protein